MLPEELREKCEELADAAAEFYNLDESEREDLYDGLLKLVSGEAVLG